MTPLSPAAQAIWDAFNEEEAGVFVDYGDKLAAALRAAADQVVPHEDSDPMDGELSLQRRCQRQRTRSDLLAIADELAGRQP